MRNEISETLFKIHADYRKNNSVKNLYYVLASNKRVLDFDKKRQCSKSITSPSAFSLLVSIITTSSTLLASNKREAKKKFVNIITWLNVYSVEECSKEETSIILSEPNKHIIILY